MGHRQQRYCVDSLRPSRGQRPSRQRFEQAAELERGLIDLLRETAPDMEKGDTFPLHLRLATQRLKDDGHAYALPELSAAHCPQHCS